MRDYLTSWNKPWTTHKIMAKTNLRRRNRLWGLVLDAEEEERRRI
jgi:hypothetical protein